MENNKFKGRTLCVGDIHGGYRALQDVLLQSNFNYKKDRLICLGDYVDGWSESAEVISMLINIKHKAEVAGNGDNIIFIRGNHDKWCEEWMNTGVGQRMWLTQGGASTVESYMRLYNGAVPSEHIMFMYKLNNYYIDEQNRGFVHGGFVSRKGLGHDAQQSDYYWDRDMWQLAVLLHGREHEALGNNKALRFKKHEEVYIGHTATTLWKCKPHYPEFENDRQEHKSGQITVPMNRCNVWDLDTGGGWDGKLTIMDIDSKEYWQSEFVKDLYPNEKGR